MDILHDKPQILPFDRVVNIVMERDTRLSEARQLKERVTWSH